MRPGVWPALPSASRLVSPGGAGANGKDGCLDMSRRLAVPDARAAVGRLASLAATLCVALPPSAVAVAGTTLHNGIVLPDEWPPRIEKLSREPMPVPYLEKRPEVVPIDVGRQLFVDDFLIEHTTLKRTFHAARYHPASPVLRPDREWERSGDAKPCAMVFSDGVWYDPAERIFKMWYMGGYGRGTCYATSTDGVVWTRPALDVVPGTNIVATQTERDSTTIWLDQRETDRSRRYKMAVVTQCRDERGGAEMAIRYSSDGIHWAPAVARRWTGGDRSTFFYNPFLGKWVYSFRVSPDPVGRARMYVECADLAEGLDRRDAIGRLWTCADRLDPRNPNNALKNVEPQLYNLDAVAYESLMLGLFSIWQGDPGMPVEKRNEVFLGYSRDGFHWHRPDRRPFAGVNETDGAWNWGNVQSAGGGCLVVGDELYFYVSGRGRNRATDPAVTGLAVLRRDGFASMDADQLAALSAPTSDAAGTLTTRPLLFKGKYLFVNADARGGELRVEVLDRDGRPIAPYGRRACQPMTTDSTIRPIQWMHARDLAAVAGTPVRLRFHLTGARLYSFWVSPDEGGASLGYVAAGGPGYTEPRDTTGLAGYRAAAIAASQAAATGDWICVTPHAPFTPRDTAEDFVFRGKMWLSNGWRPSVAGKGGEELTRDLWCSSDGKEWKRVCEATPYDPYSEMVVFKDRVWAIKGSVWNSPDGEQWEKVLDRTPFGNRGYGEAVVLNGRIWQLGSGEDVWCTEDGTNWTCVTKKAPYGDRAATAVAAYDGKLWLMAGRVTKPNDPPEKGYKDFTTFNDVWCSADGVAWTRVLDRAPWPPRQWAIAVAYAGRLWLIGGHDNVNSTNLGDVWWTKDGKAWTRFDPPTRFAPRHEVTPYVFDGSLWVVAGNTWPVVNDVWRLTLPGPAAPSAGQ